VTSLRGQGLPETDDAVTVFPLAAGLEECDAFETLEDIALGASGTGGLFLPHLCLKTHQKVTTH